MDTLEVWVDMVYNIGLPLESVLNLLIPTSLEPPEIVELAQKALAPEILTQLMEKLQHQEHHPLFPYSLEDLSPFLLMLVTGLHTIMVSSPTVQPEPITKSYFLDTLALIILSKTLGVQVGENQDI